MAGLVVLGWLGGRAVAAPPGVAGTPGWQDPAGLPAWPANLGEALAQGSRIEANAVPSDPADGYRITAWRGEQGLPQNTVVALLQGRNGYLWVGTRYGLARFDGVRFTSFVDELIALGGSLEDVRGLAEDGRGRLWFHSREALGAYENGGFRRVSIEDLSPHGPIQALVVDPGGALWLLHARHLVRRNEDGTWIGVAIPALRDDPCNTTEEADRIWVDNDGGFWIRSVCWSGRRALWRRYDPVAGDWLALADRLGAVPADVGGLRQDSRGRWWLARPGELRCWDRGQWTRYPAAGAWDDAQASQIVEDGRGRVWIATEGRQPLHAWVGGRLVGHGGAGERPGPEEVRCILPDREGNLWVGTGREGLVRLSSRPVASMLAGELASLDEVYSVAAGGKGRVWMATASGLVLRQADTLVLLTNTLSAGPDGWLRRARVVLEDRLGRVWAGTDRGLTLLRSGRLEDVVIPPVNYLRPPLITSLLEDRSGVLWVGTAGGLLERREDVFRLWSTNQGLAHPEVFGLAEASDGALWIGTRGGGLHRRHRERFEVLRSADGLLSDEVWPLRVERDGTVWAGTPKGINRIRGRSVRSVTRKEGLHENLVFAWFEDDRGQVWTYGNRGVSRMRRAELEAVADGRAGFLACVNYGESDGMASSEGNGDQQPNAARDRDGTLWFPMTRGVVVISTGSLEDNALRPTVVIEEVRVDERAVLRDGGWSDEGGAARAASTAAPGEDRELRIAPGRGRVVELRYTANTFVDSEKARFRYRLEGLDSDWRDAGTRRVAFYTSLRPGAYRFLVQARNHHGYWSDAPAVFAFRIEPRFHERTIFLVLCAMAGGLVLGAGHVLGVRAKRRSVRRRHHADMERERARIAKDLHDELGSSLTGLALRLDAVRAAGEVPATTASTTAFHRLDGVTQAMRALVDRLREVVWTINPQCDNLESFVAYLCAQAESFLATAGLRCRLDVPMDLPSRPLSAEARHHLLMVAREALHNAVRHAQATEVRVVIGVDRDGLVMSIADNGRGFVPPVAGSERTEAAARSGAGNGLANMRTRTAALGADLEVAASLGLGTRVTVRLRQDPHV